MQAFPLVLTLAAAGPAPAPSELAVLNPVAGETASAKMLYSYLQAEAQTHFEARRAAVDALATPDDVRRRQEDLRAKFVAALGGFPERTPLNPRVAGTLACDSYRLEKVIYESRPGHHVTANLYLPEGKPPFPGVLVPCGHSANGKASEPYQRVSILLAKNGIAALCYDPIGQGERSQLLNEAGKPRMGNTAEHTVVGVGALLVGQSTATFRIWDGIRSLDYLASRPEIDPARLGCTGNSGGGTLTSYLMALDDRILAAAPSCYLTTLEKLFATIGPQDAEQNITGQVAFGMDHADYLLLRAPRPTLMCVATKDYFDIQGAWTTFREAKRAYGVLGHGERVDLFEYGDGHGFSKPRRQAAMRWMRRWLLGKDDAPEEGEFATHKDEELQCTAAGQVLRDILGERSVTDLCFAREEALAPQRARAWQGQDAKARLAEVRRRIALPDDVPAAKATEVGTVRRGDVEIRKLRFETEPGILVPALLFASANATEALPLVLYVNGAGKAGDAGPGGPVEKLAAAGHRVLALDLRGMGETSPGADTNTQSAFKEAFLAIHLNRPLLGQRVYDVLAVLGWSAAQPGGAAPRLVGIGSAGPIALHAAALDPRIAEVTLERSLLSWRAVVQSPLNRDQLATAVPGALEAYDLPDLAASLAPRPLSLISPTDAMGQPVPLPAAQDAYAACRAAYVRQGAEEKFAVRGE